VNQGKDWDRQFGAFDLDLLDISFRDARHGFAAGTHGAFLRTNDGGAHWEPATLGAALPGRLSTNYKWWQQPLRIPSPRFFLMLVFVALFAVPAVLSPPVSVPPGIANATVSDRPLEEGDADQLDFAPLVAGLSGFLRNSATQLPVTIAIDGGWGSGKTSLMRMLDRDLGSAGLRSVWFNAWHNQEESSLLASLLQAVRREAVPSIVERGGAWFRLRLVVWRIWRHRYTIVVALAMALLVYAFEEKLQSSFPDRWKNLGDAFKEVFRPAASPPPPKGSEATANPSFLESLWNLLGVIFTPLKQLPLGGNPLLALYLLVKEGPRTWRSLQAFAANPSSLLASESGGRKLGELDAQTTFRKDFRQQFGEVTWALGAHRLVIFIDDLDRCRPEKIGEMLEALNYISDAGPCAIVLGLDQDKVEAGLGLSFQTIAEETEVLPEVSVPGVVRDLLAEAQAKRHKFALNYIEKMLTLIVRVPQMTAAQFRHLLAGEQTAARTAEVERARSVEQAVLVLRPLLLCVALLLLGYYAGSALAGFAGRQSPTPAVSTASSATAPPPANPPTSPTKPASGLQPLSGASRGAAVGTNETAAAPTGPAPQFVSSETPLPGRWLAGWHGVAVVALLLAIVAPLLARRKSPSITDSPAFGKALGIWAGVLALRKLSPRAVKRFMNKLRYLAMLERPPAADQPLWRTLLSRHQEEEQGKDKRAKKEDEKGPAREAQPASDDASPVRALIPDHILVALAVMKEVFPSALESSESFNKIADGPGAASTGPPGLADMLQGVPAAWHAHQAAFGSGSQQADQYRQRFQDLSAGFMGS